MKLKIISDGLFLLTKVVNADTGEPLQGVRNIRWEAGIDWSRPDLQYEAVVTLELLDVEVELVGEAQSYSASYPLPKPKPDEIAHGR